MMLQVDQMYGRSTIHRSTQSKGEQDETEKPIWQSWIMYCLKMYKISCEVIKLIENTTENWRVKLTGGGKSLTEVKIQRGIFQRDALSPFIISIEPLNLLLRKCSGGYKLHESQEKINHLIYRDYNKLFVKNEKILETLIRAARIYSTYLLACTCIGFSPWSGWTGFLSSKCSLKKILWDLIEGRVPSPTRKNALFVIDFPETHWQSDPRPPVAGTDTS